MLLELVSSHMLMPSFIPIDYLYHVSVTLIFKSQEIGKRLLIFLFPWYCRLMSNVVEILAETLIRIVSIIWDLLISAIYSLFLCHLILSSTRSSTK